MLVGGRANPVDTHAMSIMVYPIARNKYCGGVSLRTSMNAI